MTRPWHILGKSVYGLSAVGIAAVAWLWVRSYGMADELSRASDGGVIESVVSFRGALHLARSGQRASERGWSWDAYTIPPASDWDVLYRMGTLEFRRLGFGWLRGKPFNTAQPFGNVKSWPLVPWLHVTPYNAVVVPYWFVVVVLAAPVVADAEPAAGAAASQAGCMSALRLRPARDAGPLSRVWTGPR